MKKDMTPSMNLTTKRKNQSIEKIISIAIVMSLLTQLLSPKILVYNTIVYDIQATLLAIAFIILLILILSLNLKIF